VGIVSRSNGYILDLGGECQGASSIVDKAAWRRTMCLWAQCCEGERRQSRPLYREAEGSRARRRTGEKDLTVKVWTDRPRRVVRRNLKCLSSRKSESPLPANVNLKLRCQGVRALRRKPLGLGVLP
jgi:hypothetical protein